MDMTKETVTTKTSRDQRLNFRASARQESMIRRAAEATDSTITDFILGSVLGGQQGGALGDILGGLLGGRK